MAGGGSIVAANAPRRYVRLARTDGYDRLDEDYSPADVDGNSSAITRAARIATEEKGMLVVISAGNDGNKNFKVISLPSDAKGVITVGATDFTHWSKAQYSSIGPETLDYTKPDVACFSRSGTSFSAPVIAGLAACIMEADNGLSNKAVKEIILAASHLHTRPNNYIGHGVPDANKILAQLNGEETTPPTLTKIKAEDKTVVIPANDRNMVVFHMKDERNVLLQQKFTAKKDGLRITRQKNAPFTVVATAHQLWEITW